ncbi:GcrA family cell cycle regulator [Brucella anthropi]|uniref:GcrA family cell cycle regulator n=1 Tax=Brucella anthropi TaxID=529 RepID=UPI00235E24C8|nr:GcrA family cell cycle regulator [Brucella anthropi]
MSNHSNSSTWTEDRRRIVANLLREGMSASQISECLGVSRSAIVSVVHRDATLREIGFARSAGRAGKLQPALLSRQHERPVRSRRSATERPAKPRSVVKPIVKQVEAVSPAEPVSEQSVAPEAIAAPLFLPLADLDRSQCRFPVNDAAPGEQHLFCGHPVKIESSFCGHHHRRVFVRPSKADAK